MIPFIYYAGLYSCSTQVQNSSPYSLFFQIPAVLTVTQQSLGVDKYRFIDYVDRGLPDTGIADSHLTYSPASKFLEAGLS